MTDAHPGLLETLRHPRAAITSLEARHTSSQPWGVWAGLTAIAVFGSMIYGASLSVAFPGWDLGGGALWVLISAGTGWMAFGPGLFLVTRRHLYLCAQACMVAMAYGEAYLVAGGALNLGLAALGVSATAFNAALFVVANLSMCAAVAAQMDALGVRWWKVVATWMVLLNGVGAAAFIGLAPLMR